MAWATLVERIPMMADPARYRSMLYEAFFEGKAPELTPEEAAAAEKRTVAKAKSEIGKPVAGSKLDELAALNAQAKALREQGDQLESPANG